jgi:hypothetical protein
MISSVLELSYRDIRLYLGDMYHMTSLRYNLM